MIFVASYECLTIFIVWEANRKIKCQYTYKLELDCLKLADVGLHKYVLEMRVEQTPVWCGVSLEY